MTKESATMIATDMLERIYQGEEEAWFCVQNASANYKSTGDNSMLLREIKDIQSFINKIIKAMEEDK